MSRINETLRPQINEIFFSRGVALVEGSEDVAYLMTWMVLSGRLDEFRSRGLHVIAVDGKSRLPRPVIIAESLGIPVFTAFDSDGDCQPQHRPMHESDNLRLLRLFGTENPLPFPTGTLWQPRFVQWPNNASHAIEADLTTSLGREEHLRVREVARTACGHVGGAGKQGLFIQHMLEEARSAGGTSTTLDRWCDAVIAIG